MCKYVQSVPLYVNIIRWLVQHASMLSVCELLLRTTPLSINYCISTLNTVYTPYIPRAVYTPFAHNPLYPEIIYFVTAGVLFRIYKIVRVEFWGTEYISSVISDAYYLSKIPKEISGYHIPSVMNHTTGYNGLTHTFNPLKFTNLNISLMPCLIIRYLAYSNNRY